MLTTMLLTMMLMMLLTMNDAAAESDLHQRDGGGIRDLLGSSISF